MPLNPDLNYDLDLVTRCVGSEAEPSIPIAFALSMRPQPPMSAVLSIDGPLSRAELSTEWYVPTAGAWYEARAGRVPAPPAPPAPITARAYTLEARVAGEVTKEVVDIDDEKELDERLQRLQTTEEEEGAREGASDRSDEDSSDGWETVSEDR